MPNNFSDLKSLNLDLYKNIASEVKIEKIDLKESTGMNELLVKQTEIINNQSIHIESLATLIKQNNLMIKDANKTAIEARVYSIISILIAIFAIVTQYV